MEKVVTPRKDYEGKHLSSDKQDAGRRILAAVRGAREAGGDHDNPFPPSRTIGEHATCTCGLPPVPGVVLDPFMGAGTTAVVAKYLGRHWLGIELKPEYVKMAERRIAATDYQLHLGDIL